MELRCLVFSSDQGAAQSICQVVAELGGEAEHCADNVAAVQRVAAEAFQIVIADWDEQPDAEFLLKAVRGCKPSERPLTLAIVSNDASVPKALQAGANSILRKPIQDNQIKDTLHTARSLLKARRESSNAAAASAAAVPASSPAAETANDAHLRAGEFQSAAPAPATQIDTESETKKSMEEFAAAQVNPLKDLEPTAAAVTQTPEPARDNEPRGLEWYLKRRAGNLPFVSNQSASAPAPAPEKPELVGFDTPPTANAMQPAKEAEARPEPEQSTAQEQKTETELFAYLDGELKERRGESGRSFRPGKGTIIAAGLLAACSMLAAPQAPWHGQERMLWARGRQAVHAWLNPQPITTAPAPASHEDFGRAGDEYQLPVAEPIPDATTDLSQIKVTPMVDPTAKKANTATAGDPTPSDGSTPSLDQPPSQPIQVQEIPPAAASGSPGTGQAAAPGISVTPVGPAANAVAPPAPVHADSPPIKPSPSLPAQRTAPRMVASATSNASIPTSLKSQMASPTPELSGNRAPETALPSIEPVELPEATERGLLTAQPAIAYPSNAKGQQGTVVLGVLIGRDGTVEDAKFLQGSLAFARAAIDGVKQWSFKPYLLNGRAVSVQTKLTLNFQPGH